MDTPGSFVGSAKYGIDARNPSKQRHNGLKTLGHTGSFVGFETYVPDSRSIFANRRFLTRPLDTLIPVIAPASLRSNLA